MKNQKLDKLESFSDPIKRARQHVRFSIEDCGDRKKLIGTSIDKEDNFREFAYFKVNITDAKTAILAKYAYR